MLVGLNMLREEAGMSVPQLAEKLGKADGTVWSWERGDRSPDLETACKIADIFDCSLDMLVHGKEKDRLEKRSIGELVEMYDRIPAEELNLIRAVIDTAIANRRYRETLHPDSQANT